jgi:hypothetical protein
MSLSSTVRPQRSGKRLAQGLMAAAIGMAAMLGPARADVATGDAAPASGLQFTFGGFYNLTAAKALRTERLEKEYRLRCDCYIAEYSQGGVYEDGRIGWKGDSKLGLQGMLATADRRWTVAGQVVARGAADGKVNLEWLYATHELDGQWTVQAGRKRLPLLSQSEVQDVAIAYPWVRLPQNLYGWDIVNYNGANLRWRGTAGGLGVSANVFGGSETVEDSPFHALYYTDGTRTDTRWSRIRGMELELAWREVKLRAATVAARTSNRYFYPAYPEEPQGQWETPVPMRISTVALMAEPGPWILHAEFFYGDRSQEWGRDKGWMLAAGHRIGEFQVVFTHARYQQLPNELATSVERTQMNSVVVRWDVAPGRAWKAQLEDSRDLSPNITVGSRRMLSVSYTGAF